jgi:hypothetical protein
MGLRACLTCSAMISTNAKRCPQCGEPSPHVPEGHKRVIFAVFLVIFAVVAISVVYRMHESTQEQEQRWQNFPR